MPSPTSSSRKPASPRWHRRKETRPAEILAAALEEFVERGFAATRLEDIARRAGCTKGTIFLYFPNKVELFKAMVREQVLPRIQQAEQRIDAHEGTARDLLENVLRSRWDGLYHSSLSGLPKLMFSEAGNFPELARFYHDEVVSRSQAVVKRILELGIQRGEFRDVDVHTVANVMVSPMLMAVLWKHSFAHCAPKYADAQAFFDTALDFLLRGLDRGASPGGQP